MFDYSLTPDAKSDPKFPKSAPLKALNRMIGRIPDAVPYRSYSQVKKYAACPLQWRLSREFEPAFVPAGLMFGGGFHAAVETFYRARLAGRAAGRGELLDAYDLHWARETADGNPPVRFTAKLEDAAGMRDLAARMLETFLDAVRPGAVIAVEEPFVVTLAPDLPPIVGRIDLIELRKDADGINRLHLVDFKTLARRPTGEDLDADQLLLYEIAAAQVGWTDTAGMSLALRFDTITKAKNPEFISVPVTATRHGFARLVEKIRHCHNAMEAGICYPAPSWSCASCGYAAQCAEWPNQQTTSAA